MIEAAIIGLAAGVVAGMLGVGGGVLFVPGLVLGMGLSQVDAEASSLLANVPVALVGAWRQHRYGNVRWGRAAVVGVTAIVGVELGIRLAKTIPEDDLRRLFGALMILVAAQLVWRARTRDAA